MLLHEENYIVLATDLTTWELGVGVSSSRRVLDDVRQHSQTGDLIEEVDSKAILRFEIVEPEVGRTSRSGEGVLVNLGNNREPHLQVISIDLLEDFALTSLEFNTKRGGVLPRLPARSH